MKKLILLIPLLGMLTLNKNLMVSNNYLVEGQGFPHFGPTNGCKSSVECKKEQCCVGMMPSMGQCRSLSRTGFKCHVKETLMKPFKVNKSYCPCGAGLKCVPDGIKSKHPTGTCQKD